ncbi:protein SCO1/2 [Hasllibacter halocynthiae]|uniref:Protein SCO1/2 n=1 Tax=Hasllibacter halocynthiae TaxID=595589 RepID=A0A2T0X3Z1_9RHOB|nr:SCO family protein [Hasllibacter halocynthiae]PRY93666.1 protein SCO1/2 [Hasllibacter halocynthiae]
MTRIQMLFLAGVAAIVMVAGLAAGNWWVNRSQPWQQAVIGAPFELVDHDGGAITEAAFDGQVSLLFFGFTHCPEICPTTVYEMENWLRALGEEGEEVEGFFVSVDPERDTPEAMKPYLEGQSDRITGITGEPEDVWDMARSWSIYWAKGEDLGGGNYNVDHTSTVYVLDRDGNLAGTIGYGEDEGRAVETIRRVLRG